MKKSNKKSDKNGLVEFGLGIVSFVVSDAMVNWIKKLEKEGKLTKKDGEKMMQDLIKKYNSTSSKFEKEVRSQVDDLIKASPIATKKDLDDINAKIEELRVLSKKANVRVTKKKNTTKKRK
jgi:polyhydroxyalkanoate synthesis regulator phasin